MRVTLSDPESSCPQVHGDGRHAPEDAGAPSRDPSGRSGWRWSGRDPLGPFPGRLPTDPHRLHARPPAGHRARKTISFTAEVFGQLWWKRGTFISKRWYVADRAALKV